jgi:hypothetical protein
MRFYEILSELSFQGRKCTKDCSGHSAGYAWAKRNPGKAAASHSPSFNGGAQVHADQAKVNKIVRPKIRDNRGKFAPGPQARKPVASNPTTPIKPVAPK